MSLEVPHPAGIGLHWYILAMLIHWLGAALGVWPRCELSSVNQRGEAGALVSYAPRKGRSEKTAHFHGCYSFIPHYTQQTQKNNINLLPLIGSLKRAEMFL